MKELYPEDIYSCDNQLCLYESDLFDDFKSAEIAAQKNGGCVYTMIDEEGIEILYAKGCWYFNKIGICVLKHMEDK
jgi:hypothetical protein